MRNFKPKNVDIKLISNIITEVLKLFSNFLDIFYNKLTF